LKVKGLIKLLFVSVFLFSSLVFAPGLNASAKTAPPKIEVKSKTKVYYDKLKTTKTTLTLYYQLKTANKKKYYKYLRVEGKVDVLDKRVSVQGLELRLHHAEGNNTKMIKVYNKKPTTKFIVYAPNSWKELGESKGPTNDNSLAYIAFLDLKAPKTGVTWYMSGVDGVYF